MTFWEYLEAGLKVCLFDKKAVKEIVDDPEHRTHSLMLTVIVTVIAAVIITIAAVLLSHYAPQLPLLEVAGTALILIIVSVLVLAIVLTLASVWLTHLIAKLLGGKATVFQYFNAWLATNVWLGIASGVLLPMQLMPLLGGFLLCAYSVYSIAVTVFVIRETYSLNTARAVAVVAILSAIALAVALILAVIFVVPYIVYLAA